MITDMGITVAVQADAVAAFDGDPEGLRSEVRDLADQATVGLQRFVGGIRPRSEVAINFAGPENDPLQGWIYGLTVAAKFDTDDLPVDCEAYRVYVTERGERGA